MFFKNLLLVNTCWRGNIKLKLGILIMYRSILRVVDFAWEESFNIYLRGQVCYI